MKQYSIVRNGKLINVVNEKEAKRIMKNDPLGCIEIHEIMNFKDHARDIAGRKRRR